MHIDKIIKCYSMRLGKVVTVKVVTVLFTGNTLSKLLDYYYKCAKLIGLLTAQNMFS